ncbi:hypothetical protein FACS1894172_12700 [Spirochaetia bacterium]|nr:hypothetical protein FACS1894172_12700 [Spirochaetia bacterium]
MNRLTLSEICRITKLPESTVRSNLSRYGIKAASYEAMYDIDSLEPLWNVVIAPPRPVGRPKKKAEPELHAE